MNLEPEDVGKRVRLVAGDYFVITSYNPIVEQFGLSNGYYYHSDGIMIYDEGRMTDRSITEVYRVGKES